MKRLHRAVDERFHSLRLLGEGATSRVFEVEDRWRGGRYALKQLRRDRISAARIAKLRAELLILTGNAHQNLASGYELVCEEGMPSLEMELVAGVDFLRYVRPDAAVVSDPLATHTADTFVASSCRQAEALGGTLEVTRLRSALRQIAAGLRSLHDRGHLHCDLKPENVIVTPEGRAVIVDFGSCSRVGLRPGQFCGTPGFMPPEQLVGELTEASDWYAFGALMQCALTGRLPYGTSSVTKHSVQFCSSRLDARVLTATCRLTLWSLLCVSWIRLRAIGLPVARSQGRFRNC